MNNDFINNVTLDCLISSQQRIKLNNLTIKKKENSLMTDDKNKYKEEILALFVSLLNETHPDNILTDVIYGFDLFLQKSIYYLKLVDENTSIIQDNIKEEEELEEELEEEEDEYENEEDEYENEEDENEEDNFENNTVIKVKPKYTQKTSNGVDEIHNLPLDWFNNVKTTYEKHHIINKTTKKF